MRLRRLAAGVSIWFLVFTVAPAAPVGACPVCDTGTGQEVRAGIFDQDFGWNLLATLLPFPLLLGIVGLIHFGFPALPRRKGNPTHLKDSARDA